MDNTYLMETEMLDFSNQLITNLVTKKNWNDKNDFQKIKEIYEYVQNDIVFGYNRSDTLSASKVLEKGIGQCNTKATLLMALLRAVGIPCRLHGFFVTKDFQRGATTFLIAKAAPNYIVHTWVEVYFQDQWYVLEGVILDKEYLQAIQNKYHNYKGIFKGYAIATKDLSNPPIDWNQNDTYIQKESIVHDFGIFPSPDVFFKQHPQDMSKVKEWIYIHLVSRIMTRTVRNIRNKK